MIAACSKGMISLWDTKNLSKPFLVIKGIIKLILDENKDYILSVNFLLNDSHIISGFSDGYILLYDIKDPTINYRQKIESNIPKGDSNFDSGNSVFYDFLSRFMEFQSSKSLSLKKSF